MPSKENHSRIFYGWWIVAAAVPIALYTGGIIFYGFTAIFEPIANEFGWSYTQISIAASLRGLETGLLAPVTGMLADRWGPRKLMFGGIIIVVISLILLSLTQSLIMLYASFALMALGVSACSITIILTAIANWFRTKVGMATGIAVSGYGLSGLLVPIMVILIDIYGWRMTMTILALPMLVLILPLTFVFRHKPEQYGYFPDGQAEEPIKLDASSELPKPVEVNIKLKQALKKRTFWQIALAFTCHPLLTGAISTHVMPYLSSIGIARSISSLVATAIPLMSIGGRLGFGWLGDRFDRRWVAAGAYVLIALGALCFEYTANVSLWLLIPFLLLFGSGYGGSNVMRASLTREYFGRANFGAVFGFVIGINMLGGIIGPTVAGWVYDNWGSYQGIWLILACLTIAAIILLLTISPTSKTDRMKP